MSFHVSNIFGAMLLLYFGQYIYNLDWLMQVAMLLFQSIAGNIMTASPISDLNPLFLAAQCHLTVSSKGAIYRVGKCKEHRHRKNCMLSVLCPTTTHILCISYSARTTQNTNYE